MSLPTYASYRDSCVQSLGYIPAHWTATAIKHLGRLKGGAGFPHEDQGTPGEELSFHKVSAIGQADATGHLLASENTISREVAQRLGAFIFPPGTIVFAKVGAALLLGRIRQLRETACIDNNMMGLMVFEDAASVRFVRWAISLLRFDLIANPGAVPSINEGQIGEFRLPVPPRPEQEQIADFLERETASIESLISSQQRLIELLNEKRQAVISHAVTKGLNPNAPMKPSGVEWLGDVPAHWTVASVRRIVRRIEQGWSPECLGRPAEPQEWGVVKSGCVNRGVFVERDNKALPEALDPIPEYEIRPGDVLISRASGSPELVGSTAHVAATRPRLMLSDKIFRVHTVPTIDRLFFVAVFNSSVMRSQIERAISGAEGLANNLPQSALKGFFLAYPPTGEQEAIVQHLARETGKLDALMAEAQHAVSLLQERRTALISAAVTGQIDVRGLVAAEAEVVA